MEKNESVALLVDGDNISATYAGQILRRTREEVGEARVCRVYCGKSALTDWESADSFRKIYAGKGTNSSDILLSIDAAHMALSEGIETFVIASSDSDFRHVAQYLGEAGVRVFGIGEEKAPQSFRCACKKFIQLTPASVRVDDGELAPLDKTLRAIFSEQDSRGHGILVNRLNPLVRAKDPNVKISTMKDKTWFSYLSDRPKLYTITGEGQERRVTIARQND